MNAEELRRKGNAAFTAKKFDEAISLFTQASPRSEGEEGRGVGVSRGLREFLAFARLA